MHANRSAGHDEVLVPVVDPDIAAKSGAITDIAHQPLRLAGRHFNDLSAPGKDSHGCVLRIELASVNKAAGPDRKPEIRLRAGHHPVNVRLRVARPSAPPRQTSLATILNATAAAIFH